MTHKLKTWQPYFDEVQKGFKTFEVRFNDREFKVGDTLLLREWMPPVISGTSMGLYTGRTIKKRVIYVLRGGQFGIEKLHVVMGLGEPLKKAKP